MKYKEFVLLLCVIYKVNAVLELQLPGSALDHDLYDSVLDPELCDRQLDYMFGNNTLLLLRFLDAGLKIPRGILIGNLVDFGNYQQCLGIKEEFEQNEIQGKYCSINTNVELGQINSTNYEYSADQLYYDYSKLKIPNELREKIEKVKLFDNAVRGAIGDFNTRSDPFSITFLQGICIPKTCSLEQSLSTLSRIDSTDLEYTENFCRLENDKPWVAADYVAISIFSIIGILTLLSTAYDLNYTFILKRDPKQANIMYRSFSIYTNTKTLVTFSNAPGAITCLDGIRSISMAWIILGHVPSTHSYWMNVLEAFEWSGTAKALWVTTAPACVDTFFLLSGLLIVYTTAGKVTGVQLLRQLPFFYLNRLLRMFPLLATTVLLQASLLNKMLDGPMWSSVAVLTDRCRQFWWSTLLHVQNFVNPESTCIPHSWYLAIDVQLHILSPLVLYWVLLNRKFSAWSSLTIGLVSSLTATTVYCFIMQFRGGLFVLAPQENRMRYVTKYYMHTLPRSPPFFVGLIMGYLLHLNRGRKVTIPKTAVVILWMCAAALFSLVPYTIYLVMPVDWDNQTVDSLINSFSRAAWALALGWMIFACVHGYSGPINWFLSLKMWRLPARLSYAMYLFHYPLMFVTIATRLAPPYFSVVGILMEFLQHFSLNLILAFMANVLIDTPISILCKILLGGGLKKTDTPNKEVEIPSDRMKDKE